MASAKSRPGCSLQNNQAALRNAATSAKVQSSLFSTVSRGLLLLRMARSTSATGFIVGCRSFLAGLSKCQTFPWSRAPHQ
jgi:hypothetical protein